MRKAKFYCNLPSSRESLFWSPSRRVSLICLLSLLILYFLSPLYWYHTSSQPQGHISPQSIMFQVPFLPGSTCCCRGLGCTGAVSPLLPPPPLLSRQINQASDTARHQENDASPPHCGAISSIMHGRMFR